MKNIKDSSILDKYDYLSCPLFKELRKQDECIIVYEKIYNEKPEELVKQKKTDEIIKSGDEVGKTGIVKLFDSLETIFKNLSEIENS